MIEEPAARDADPEHEAASLELSDRVRRHIESLPAPQRIALELAFFEELTHAEIAATLQQPLGTIKTRIRLALLRLRDALTTGPASAVDRTPSPFTVALSRYLAARAIITPSALSGITVLAVDDNQDTLDLVRTVLESAGARVVTRVSAPTAVSHLRESWPDVMLSDICMPGCDGYSLADEVHALARERRRALPVVAFSVCNADQAPSPDSRARFAAHLQKPIPPHRMIEIVAELCGRSVPASRALVQRPRLPDVVREPLSQSTFPRTP